MLTEHQNKVKEDILSIIEKGETNIILKGSAGVGKTYLVQHIIDDFRKNNPRGLVYITAPTNKAVAILKEKAKEQDGPNYEEYVKEYNREKELAYLDGKEFYKKKLSFDDYLKVKKHKVFRTIHSALLLKRKINDKTGEISFVPEYNPTKERPFDNASLIIIDEGSMLENKILIYMEDDQYGEIPKIYLGDDKQLNPVGEDYSPIFKRNEIYDKQIAEGELLPFIMAPGWNPELKKMTDVKYYISRYHEFELTEIIRQGAGNPIISLSRNLNWVQKRGQSINEQGDGYIYTRDFEKCIDMIVGDPDHIRYLAWTNAEVNRVNSVVRQKIYTVPQKLHLGETIVIGTAYTGMNGDMYSTNSELPIKKLDIHSRTFSTEIVYDKQSNRDDAYLVTDIEDPDFGRCRRMLEVEIEYYFINDNVMVVHENSEIAFANARRKLQDYTKLGMSWKTWFEFTEQFLKFHYQYALTIHKSQGSTYKTAILNMVDINRNKNMLESPRLWYTAITRAAKNIYMYEPNFVRR